tara:strand:- start:10247 stop:10897 length:651 start_codon:yes stop_codon:yes gene_type:complete
MKKKIYIFGKGGNSKIIYEISKQKYNVAGFILSDNFFKKNNNNFLDKITFKETDLIKKNKKLNIVYSFGENYLRYKIFSKYNKYNFNYPNIIHKSAFISKSANIGIGNIIMPNVIINSNARIGNFNLINTSSIIEHDCHVDSFVSISPKSIVCGNCKLNEGVFLGANTCVIHNIEIGEWSVVGSCSNVIKDIKKNTLNFGNPSKTIKKINKNYQVL